MQRPSDRLHVLDPLSLLQSQHPVSSSGPSAACCLWRNCKEPTYPLSWPPCPCPAQPCKHSGTLHLTSFPRVCLCLSAYPSLVCEYRRQKCVCVCLCVGFLTFSSCSSIVPTCPCHLAFLPTTTTALFSHPFFFRPCLVASPLLLLLLILLLLSRFSLFVKTISTHHSFPPPVQLNSRLL